MRREGKRKHFPTYIFGSLFLILLLVAETPYLGLKDGSLLKAVLMPVHNLAFSFFGLGKGPLALLPIVIFSEILTILSFTGLKVFFAGRKTKENKSFGMQDKYDDFVEMADLEKSEKELAFEKAVAGMSHKDALEILKGATSPDFEKFPNTTTEDIERKERTSTTGDLFEFLEVEEPVEVEEEPADDVEEMIIPAESERAKPVFGKLKTRDIHREESVPEDDSLSDEELERTKSKKTDIDYVSGVGGLKRAKEGYLYDPKKYKYEFPSETLLNHYPSSMTYSGDIVNDEDGKTIVETFGQFRIDTKLVGIQHGPTFTLYELVLAKGIKVSTILGLSDNIAMDLAVQSVRILAPIPGKSAIGVEVPNRKRDIIGFDEMMNELKTKSKKYRIPMVLGKTITGDRIVVDLASAPHMLIAGTTGSGKSVCVNGLISSILYTKTPREVRMILVDPKMVELTVYNDIPHLLTPVITEPKRAIKAMAYVVTEMERRMALFSKVGARKIEDYNEKIKGKGFACESLPYIMVIVDEFADLMMVVGKELESYIKRITAVARFTGIHLVLATQRPSADVITGIIKSNMPTQIAFAVSNQVNSRIILDATGAEKLLGRGDMLYSGAAGGPPQRIQGAYIDQEIEKIVSFVKTQGQPDYIDESFFEDPEEEPQEDLFGTVTQDEGGKSEDMFTRAWRIVAERGEASASYIQRRMSIGYNRAANLIEQLEDAGYIGPARGSKPREILKFPDPIGDAEDKL